MGQLQFILLLSAGLHIAIAEYRVGIGISDVTGPIAEVPFMGYAKPSQSGSGLHLRQYARAFTVEDESNRIVFVNVDAAMLGNGLRKEVLARLQKHFEGKFDDHNLILSATHTHSAPGGYMMDMLFDISTFGYVRESFEALASGIVKAVVKAQHSVVNATIFLNSGEVSNANINRSPAAYLRNPESERNKYKHNVDTEITQLKFVASSDNRLLGAINWFPVHPTSMNNTNTLVSSDNVGYASILLETHFNKQALIGKGPFIAAFASSNLGDVSPNIRGPRCLNSGDPCDNVSSSCDGDAKICVASGPGKDMFDSTRIIAERLSAKALELLNDGNSREITGPLGIVHRYVDMPMQEIDYTYPNGTVTKVRGCVPAMGYSFAAGTTDGPGEFDFKQGTVTGNPLWNLMRDFLAKPTKDDIACHSPKPILLATGRANFPYQWQPHIVSTQLAMIGDVALAAVPGEFTTMSGRRLKNAIAEEIRANGGSNDTMVIIAGLSNTYSDYIVTPEEYQLQRYEAASTIFGPNTLPIYLKLYKDLVVTLLKGLSRERGPEPKDLSDDLLSLIPPVIFDFAGWKSEFGDCVQQPPATVRLGDTVTVKFISGHPRNNVMHGKSFLTVEKLIGDDDWVVVATDANWETKFHWQRTSVMPNGKSIAIVEWAIGSEVTPDIYRIRHFGHYKYIFGGIFPYEGLTKNFKVL